MDILNQYLNRIDLLILVLVRMAGIFVIAPVFGGRNFPSYMKIGFALLTSIIIASSMKTVDLDYYNSVIAYGVLVFKEAIVGILIGFIGYLIFTAIFTAGEFIDMQMGFGMVNVMDPVSNIQMPVMGNFYYTFTILIFLLINGHHYLLAALFKSYDILPIGTAVFNNELLDTMTRLIGDVFIVGFKIAAPVIIASLITDIGLGILSKTIPQLNVFVVGMPAKVFIGMVIVAITIPTFIGIVEVLSSGVKVNTITILKEMVPK